MADTRRPGRPRGAGVFDDEDLLELALDGLAAGGYRGLSMRGLARELGVSLASVQHRYPTKDDLWRAAIDRAFGAGEAIVFDDPFPEAVRRRMAAAASRPSLILALLTDDAPGHEARLAHLASRLRPVVAQARATFAEARDVGLTRDVDLEVLVALMLVGVGALVAVPPAVSEALGLGVDPADRLADGFADIVLNGIVVRP